VLASVSFLAFSMSEYMLGEALTRRVSIIFTSDCIRWCMRVVFFFGGGEIIFRAGRWVWRYVRGSRLNERENCYPLRALSLLFV